MCLFLYEFGALFRSPCSIDPSILRFVLGRPFFGGKLSCQLGGVGVGLSTSQAAAGTEVPAVPEGAAVKAEPLCMAIYRSHIIGPNMAASISWGSF